MTPLRRRLIEDLQLRNRSPKTIEAYVYHVRELARYYNQSPEQLGDDQIHRYLLHLLHHKQVSWSSYNQAVAALRFFYGVTYPCDTVVTRLPYGKRPKRLPAVRSPQQVALFFDSVHDWTNRIVLRTIYATGMRINEALHLTAAQSVFGNMRNLGNGESPDHDVDHGQMDNRLRCTCVEFIVLAHPPKPSQPCEGALHDPATRQKLESLGVVASLHDL